jgi:hypothetical protein
MASEDRILKILLQLQSDLSGGAPMQAQLSDISQKLTGLQSINAWGNYLQGARQAKTATDDVQHSAFTLEDAFKFAGAQQAFNAVIGFLKEIPTRIMEGVRSGIEFNAEIQNVQNGLAAVLQLTQSARFGSFAQAKEQAGEYIDTIKGKANELGIAYTDMFEAVQHTQAQLASAGVTDINKAIELTVSLNRAMQAVGVSSSVAARDIGDILQGRVANTIGGGRLASGMGLSKEEFDTMIKQMIQTGTLYDGLTAKLAPFQNAARDASHNFNADIERMKNSLLDLEGEAAKPIMGALQKDLQDVTRAMATDDLKAYARTLGDILAVYLGLAKGVADYSVKLGEVINKHQQLAGFLSVIPGAGSLFDVAGAISQSHDNNVAQVQFETMQKTYQALREQAIAADDVAKQEQVVADIDRAIAQLHEQMASGQVKNVDLAKQFLDNMNSLRTVLPFIAGTLAELPGHLAAANAEVQKLLDAESVARAYAFGTEGDIAKAEWGQKYNRILEDRKKLGLDISADTINELVYEQVHGAERKRDLADEASATEKVASAQKDVTDFTREQSLLLTQIRNAQSTISANPFLGADDKAALSMPLIVSEIGTLNQEIQKGQSLMSGGTLDPASYDRVAQEVDNLKTKVTQLGFQLQTLSFGGGFKAEMVEWANSFGTASKQAAGALTSTLGTAIGSTSQALTGLIFHTGNWRQTFAQAAQSIVSNLLRIALQFVVSRLIMSAVNKASGATDAAAASANAASAAVAWAPAATSASIATYGTASGTGLTAFLAALAAGIAGAAGSVVGGSGGFAAGGRVPGSPSSTDNLFLPMASGEHVLNAPATQWVDHTLGASFLDDLNQMRLPTSGGFADGGRIGAQIATAAAAGGGAVKPVINQALFMDLGEARRWLFDREGEKHIVDIVRGNLGS